MLNLIYGSEYKKVKAEADKLAADFLKSHPGSTMEKHTGESINAGDLEYRAMGSFLFGGEAIYIVQDFLDNYEEEFLKIAPRLAGSKNLFIFCEDSILKDTEKSVTFSGGKILAVKSDSKERDNPFAVTDALLERDKKTAWKLYRQEIEKGEDANAILGRFLWAMKTLNIIKKNEKENALTLGISPFVFSKTKKAANSWSLPEAQSFYTDLLFGMPMGGEMEYHVEKLILEKL